MSSRAPKRPGSSKNLDRNAKKTRFQEPTPTDADPRRKAQVQATADEQAFDEQVLADLDGPSLAHRKRAVKTDGYDSDSSDDGEGVVRSRHAGANDAADEDDDMFAPSSASGDPQKPSAKKEEKYLNLGDIEGQEFAGDPNDADDGSDVDSEDFEDEDARERKAKEGMGFELSSFNMKAEMEEGKFAEDGTFHRSFDPHGVHDKWMDGIDDTEMRKARRVKKKMEQAERSRIRDEEDAAKGKDDMYKELVSFLGQGETVLEALQRLGKGSKSKHGSSASKRPRKGRGEAANALPSVSSAMELDSSVPITDPPSTSITETPIERVTSIASVLLSLGHVDIYDESYESLLRLVRRSGIVPSDWTPPPAVPADIRFEYHWAPAYVASSGGQASATEVYGPFAKDELLAWRDALYFGDSGERIELRIVGTTQWNGWDVVV